MFVATVSATPPDPSVVRHTFLIFSSWASVLIDSGALHSFISASFARALELEVNRLDPPMLVDTPVGGRVVIDRICRGCDLTIQDRTFTCDFIVLEMM